MGSDGTWPVGRAELQERGERIHAELSKVELELWLLALGTLTLDVYLTYLGLRHGLAEGNPFMSAAFDTVGFAALGLIKAVVLGIAGFYRELRPEYGAVIALGLTIPWLVALIVNYLHIF